VLSLLRAIPDPNGNPPLSGEVAALLIETTPYVSSARQNPVSLGLSATTSPSDLPCSVGNLEQPGSNVSMPSESAKRLELLILLRARSLPVLTRPTPRSWNFDSRHQSSNSAIQSFSYSYIG
jgi:hypothetical protein